MIRIWNDAVLLLACGSAAYAPVTVSASAAKPANAAFAVFIVFFVFISLLSVFLFSDPNAIAPRFKGLTGLSS